MAVCSERYEVAGPHGAVGTMPTDEFRNTGVMNKCEHMKCVHFHNLLPPVRNHAPRYHCTLRSHYRQLLIRNIFIESNSQHIHRTYSKQLQVPVSGAHTAMPARGWSFSTKVGGATGSQTYNIRWSIWKVLVLTLFFVNIMITYIPRRKVWLVFKRTTLIFLRPKSF